MDAIVAVVIVSAVWGLVMIADELIVYRRLKADRDAWRKAAEAEQEYSAILDDMLATRGDLQSSRGPNHERLILAGEKARAAKAKASIGR